MNKLILLILILLSAVKGYSQKGFLGKRNHVEFDVFSLINQGKYSFEYRRTLNFQLQATISYKIFDMAKPLTRNMEFNYVNPNSYYNYGNYYNFDATGTLTYSATTWGVGLIFSSPFTNMPVSFGYYTGLAYERTTGTYTETFKQGYYSDPSAAYGGSNNNFPALDFNLKYLQKSNLLKIIYGKGTYLGHNLSLDLSLDIGVTWGKFIGQDAVSYKIKPADLPDNFNVIGITRPTKFSDSNEYSSASYIADAYYFFYWRLYLMPKIKIGFLF